MENNTQVYFNWLSSMVMGTSEKARYNVLVTQLFLTDFTWFIPNDDNRGFEGIELRNRYYEETGHNYYEEKVSFLEVLIALSIRCHDMSGEMTVKKWFWKLMNNVGLDYFIDERYRIGTAASAVHEIVDRILNRTYERSGEGGLFPLRKKNIRNDQRRVELWYQMCEYINDRFFIE